MEMTQLNGTIALADLRPATAKGAAPDVDCAVTGMRLADLATGDEARVMSVSPIDSGATQDVGRRLAELGFLPGEKLRIVARGLFGRDPIAVRIGTSTFALRLFEAACIRVSTEQPQPG